MMNWYRAPVVPEPQTAIPPPEGRRLRRKLQKIGMSRTQPAQASTAVKLSAQPALSKPVHSGKDQKVTKREVKSTATVSSARPSTADQEEYQRTSYFRANGKARRDPGTAPIRVSTPRTPATRQSPRANTSRPLMGIPETIEEAMPELIPEFAHLNIGNPGFRISSETIDSDGPSTPSTTTASIASTSRRQAKTPVKRIGQLEGHFRRQSPLVQRVTSIELLAESYRALLDSRCSFRTARSTPGPAELFGDEPPRFGVSSPVELLGDCTFANRPTSSDDGTLFESDEDFGYSKSPIFLSFEDQSPNHGYRRERARHVASVASLTGENHGLQICFDLLGRELSSAVSGSMLRPTEETSALQIWIMIEAYEKLRDQLARDRRLGAEQKLAMEAMFEMWLGSLHMIHDTMTGNDGECSESDYGDAQSRFGD